MIFVTGGTGLLGSHLLVELTRKYEHITAIYRDESKIENVRKCFEFYLKDNAASAFDKIVWKECDILNIPRLEELMEGHLEVYHCAGLVSFARSDFSDLIEINRYGTANMVNIALSIGVEKFCFVSSTAAVGNKDIPSDVEVTEKGKWILTNETSGYSISKYSAEKEVWRGINEGLNAVIVNPSVIFGAWNWGSGSMKMFQTISKGLKFYPPGANSIVDARDVVNIMIELMDQNVFNERFLCIGENISYKALFTMISKEMNKRPPSISVSKRFSGIIWRLAVLGSIFTFSKSQISKTSVNSAFNTIKYSNKKVKNKLEYHFISTEDTIKNAVQGRLS